MMCECMRQEETEISENTNSDVGMREERIVLSGRVEHASITEKGSKKWKRLISKAIILSCMDNDIVSQLHMLVVFQV